MTSMTVGRRLIAARLNAKDALNEYEGWSGAKFDNFPHTLEFDSLLDAKTMKIRNLCIIQKQIVKFESSLYVLVPSTMCWRYARGTIASRYLCNFLEMDGVTVNYAMAVAPYLDYVDGLATCIETIPRSVCFSSWRLSMTFRGDQLRFKQMTAVTQKSLTTEISQRIGGFSTCPLTCRLLPGDTTYTGKTLTQRILSEVIPEDSLMTLMWVIGNGLIDPVTEPRIVYLYGRGGDGKSTCINIIQNVLAGAASPLTKDYVSTESPLEVDDLCRAADSRFITCGDVNLKYGNVNTKLWKMITGGDSFASPIGDVRLTCTAFFASNDLWHENRRIREKWFTRRTVVISMKKLRPDVEKPPSGFSDFERSRFIAECIYIRMCLDTMPICIKDALVTIFGIGAERSTRGVILRETDDFEESYAASLAVCCAGLMEYEKLMDLTQAMSQSLITTDCFGRRALKGIILREEYDNPEMHGYFVSIRRDTVAMKSMRQRSSGDGKNTGRIEDMDDTVTDDEGYHRGNNEDDNRGSRQDGDDDLDINDEWSDNE